MDIDSMIDRLWMRWMDLEPGIPYWNPWVGSLVLFVIAVVLFCVLGWLRRASRSRRSGMTFARMRLERDKRIKKAKAL